MEIASGEEDRAQEDIELTDLRQLGIATLGTLKEHPRIKRFRDFLKGWYLSYFNPDMARSIPSAGAQRHLNSHGDNMRALHSTLLALLACVCVGSTLTFAGPPPSGPVRGSASARCRELACSSYVLTHSSCLRVVCFLCLCAPLR